MPSSFNNVEEVKNFLGHGYYDKAYEEIFTAYQQGLIAEEHIAQIRVELQNGKSDSGCY